MKTRLIGNLRDKMFQNDEVATIRLFRNRQIAAARESILNYIDRYSEGYSREFRDKIPLDLRISLIRFILKGLQKEGLLTSEIRYPPFKGCGGGFRREYFRRNGS